MRMPWKMKTTLKMKKKSKMKSYHPRLLGPHNCLPTSHCCDFCLDAAYLCSAWGNLLIFGDWSIMIQRYWESTWFWSDWMFMIRLVLSVILNRSLSRWLQHANQAVSRFKMISGLHSKQFAFSIDSEICVWQYF